MAISDLLLALGDEVGDAHEVVWKITPLFAEWVTSPDNLLSRTSVITDASTVLELGCGVSGILALALGPRIQRYVATDQEYVFKLLKQNLEGNTLHANRRANAKDPGRSKSGAQARALDDTSNVEILALDWETSDLSSLPRVLGSSNENLPVDVVLACDCIYNEALIEPFVRTCAELCRMSGSKPTVCVIAQQLRSHEVFEAWLAAFLEVFRVWRVEDELLTTRLKGEEGFVVHVGVLRGHVW